MIRLSNKSAFEQPSRTNCVRKLRFDCIEFALCQSFKLYFARATFFVLKIFVTLNSSNVKNFIASRIKVNSVYTRMCVC